MKWQGYLETNMGYELVKDDFPERFNRDDVSLPLNLGMDAKLFS